LLAPSQWSHQLDDAERRDPLGHTAHLIVGLLFLFTMPLGTATANIVSVVLLSVAVLRMRSCGMIYLRVLRWPPAWLAMLFVAWAAISVSWSSDPALAARLLSSMRVLLLPLALAPLLPRAPLLASALLAGITLQACVQCGEYAMNRMAWNFDGLARFGGFTGDPGKAGLWDALGVCGAMAAALTLRGRWRFVMPIIALICLGGVAASGTRRQLLALAVAVPALMAFGAVRVPERRVRVIIMVLALGAALGVMWPAIGPSIMARVRQTSEQMDPQHTRPPIQGIVHYDLRGYYWRASLEAWRRVPLHGLGLGGTAAATTRGSDRPAVAAWLQYELVREYPTLDEATRQRELESRLNSRHPHSTWMQLLVELGLVGLGLGLATWFAAWGATVRAAWRRGATDPVALACAAGLLAWAIGAVFDASINSASLGAAAVLAALGGLAPPRARLTPPSELAGCPARARS